MKNTIENQTTFVAFFVGNYQGTTRVQLVIIRTEPLQGDLVKTNPDQVLKQLEQKGKAAIYGIYFDHDKSDIKPESAGSLKVIADVLSKNNSLNLYVVGHTDDKGSPEYNLGLSSKRAKAVVKASEKKDLETAGIKNIADIVQAKPRREQILGRSLTSRTEETSTVSMSSPENNPIILYR